MPGGMGGICSKTFLGVLKRGGKPNEFVASSFISCLSSKHLRDMNNFEQLQHLETKCQPQSQPPSTSKPYSILQVGGETQTHNHL